MKKLLLCLLLGLPVFGLSGCHDDDETTARARAAAPTDTIQIPVRDGQRGEEAD